MGTYLSRPKTDKQSHDVENESLVCGVSSMQGWRESQEDAHSCILDFDENVSLFAVYDGHGGSEVAQYAAAELPSMVKNNFYEEGHYADALIKAFLNFDKKLINPAVVEKLTSLRNGIDPDEVQCCDGEENKEEELDELVKEAKMSLEEIVSKYGKKECDVKSSTTLNIDEQPGSSSSSSAKLKSTNEVEANDESISSNSKTVEDGDGTNTNGVDENEPQDSGKTTGSTKINGTPKNGTECGASSSKRPSRAMIESKLSYLISGELANDDEDEDDDAYIATFNDNDSDASDDDNDDDDDDDDDEEEEFVYEDYSDDEDDEINDHSVLFDNDDDNNGGSDEETAGKDSGCTAVMALLVQDKLFVANAGDSRCVASIDGHARDMSTDHKPEDELELKRINAAGGNVSSDGRVNGGLNLSRALGDHNYKKNTILPDTEQMITALPEINILDLVSQNVNFIVLACDGIWNSMSSQEVVNFILNRIDNPDVKLSTICEELFDKCLAPNTLSDGTGCDNMTCIIIKLKSNTKRPHTAIEQNNPDDGVECKKRKMNSTESESVQ